MDIYYVYAHITKHDGKIFYIGKGMKKRFEAEFDRNKKWHEVTEKNEYHSVFLFRDLSEDEAYEKEREMIIAYKKIGQCEANVALGGRGIKVEKRWWGEKISKSLKGIKRAKGEKSKLYKDFAPKAKIAEEYTQKGMSSSGLAKKYRVSEPTILERLRAQGINIRAPGRKRVPIICKEDGKRFTSINDAARFYGLYRENIIKVLRGTYKKTGNKTFSYENN